jgi:hypothetical protein
MISRSSYLPHCVRLFAFSVILPFTFAKDQTPQATPAAIPASGESKSLPAQAELGNPADANGIILHSKCQPLSGIFSSSVVALDDRRLAMVANGEMATSSDDGETYSNPTPLLPSDQSDGGRPNRGLLLKTAKGTLVLVYPTQRKLTWDRQTGEPGPDIRADVWVIRSTDGGRTWRDRQEISALFHNISPYCLCVVQFTQATDGTLVVPLQLRMRNHNRSVLTAVISPDDGKTWQPSRTILDIGGAGVHDGLLEPTLAPLRDGRLWMLIRTNLDVFYESFSEDSGRTWSPAAPTMIDASSSPGFLLRLSSGRLMLLWNRLYPTGTSDYPRRSGMQFSSRPASWNREELSLSFSPDDGKTWSPPVVMAHAKGSVAYPYAIERRPGEIWVVLKVPQRKPFRLFEADFIDAVVAR